MIITRQHARADRKLSVPHAHIRKGIIGVAVLVAHVGAIYLLTQHNVVRLSIDAAHPAGASVQVSVIAASTQRAPASPARRVESRPAPSLEQPERPPGRRMPTKSIFPSKATNPRTSIDAKADRAPPAQIASLEPPAAESTATQSATHGSAPPAPRTIETPMSISDAEFERLGCQIPQPQYPAKARRLGQEGKVVVGLTISTEGEVAEAKVIQSSGYAALDASALAAIRAGHCRPYIAAGISRVVATTQPIAFNLND
jgi:periplasmic protein TonB